MKWDLWEIFIQVTQERKVMRLFVFTLAVCKIGLCGRREKGVQNHVAVKKVLMPDQGEPESLFFRGLLRVFSGSIGGDCHVFY
jgi:hypothetical protein